MANPYELRYSIYNDAKQGLMDKFYNDYEVWSNWQFDTIEPHMAGECPIKQRPTTPTHEEVLVEAEKIYSFVQKKD
jgi:hypothetical protein